MAEHGGYRKPSSPAAVSGPGSLSQRTDGRPNVADLSDAKYGENKTFRELQGGAPMGPTPSIGAPAVPPPQMPTPLGAPTQFPDQPVTAGASVGPGPGANVLGIPDSSDEVADLRRRYGQYVPLLIRHAAHPSTSEAFKSQVRYLLSVIM